MRLTKVWPNISKCEILLLGTQFLIVTTTLDKVTL